MSAIIPAGFAYSDLHTDAANVARAAAAAIKGVMAQSLTVIGQHLRDAKAALPHGAFTAWAEKELGMSDRSARNYMQAAAWLADKPETISVLPPSIVYALSAPSAPADVVASVVADAAVGATLSPDLIQTKLDQARKRAQDIRKVERRQPDLTHEEARAKAEARERREAARRAKAVAEADAEHVARWQRVQPLAEKLHQVAPELAEVLRDHRLAWALQDALRELAATPKESGA